MFGGKGDGEGVKLGESGLFNVVRREGGRWIARFVSCIFDEWESFWKDEMRCNTPRRILFSDIAIYLISILNSESNGMCLPDVICEIRT